MTAQCLVFDIDDTLYLERDYVYSGFRAVGEWLKGNHGLDGFQEAAWQAFEAGHRGDIFDRALMHVSPGGSADAPLVRRLVQVYREHEPSITLLADAEKVIREWFPRPMAVITDGPLESQRRKASALGLQTYMQPIVFTGAFGPEWGKPSPVAFAEVERQLSLPGDACVYIADNPAKDFGGAQARGWGTVRVRRTGGLYYAVTGAGKDADAEVSDLNTLFDVLPGIGDRPHPRRTP